MEHSIYASCNVSRLGDVVEPVNQALCELGRGAEETEGEVEGGHEQGVRCRLMSRQALDQGRK